MGFRTGSYATIWEIRPENQVRTSARISISRKNKTTGEYDTDFSGFVEFIGTGAANKALGLKPRDRIKLGDVDVSNRYVKEKNTTYTNYKIFSFDMPQSADGGNTAVQQAPVEQNAFMYDGGENAPTNEEDEYLPF